MSQVGSHRYSSNQHVRPSRSRDLLSSAVHVKPSSATHRCMSAREQYYFTHANTISATRIATKGPEEVFKKIVKVLLANVPPNQVLTEESKERLFACLINLEVQFDPTKRHVNPEMPGYFSSSYDAELGRHVAPCGGFGPPQDVIGSFCHDHTDESFAELHPKVDLDTYKAPVSSQGRKTRSGAKPSRTRATAPAIVFTDATDISEQASSEKPAHVAAEGGLKVGVYKPRSALASKSITVNTTAVKASTFKATAVQATAINVIAEKENNIPMRTGTGEGAVATEQPAAATSHTAEKLDTKEVAGTAKKESQDSGYDSQPRIGAISLSEDQISALPADSGSSDVHGGSSDVHCGSSDVDNDNTPTVPRNKLTPKKPIATRRSPRISASTTDSQPASDSSLGKHERQADTDTEAHEPEGKRTKAILP
jgi:hypothetical protein